MSSAETTQSQRGSRRKARRLALQALYQWLIAGTDPEELLEQLPTQRKIRGADWGYTKELVNEVVAREDVLDKLIVAHLDRPLQQLDTVERAVLLLGGYELAERADVPAPVVINEGVNLAKEFGATDSHKYINGVLDRLARELRDRPPGATST